MRAAPNERSRAAPLCECARRMSVLPIFHVRPVDRLRLSHSFRMLVSVGWAFGFCVRSPARSHRSLAPCTKYTQTANTHNSDLCNCARRCLYLLCVIRFDDFKFDLFLSLVPLLLLLHRWRRLAAVCVVLLSAAAAVPCCCCRSSFFRRFSHFHSFYDWFRFGSSLSLRARECVRAPSTMEMRCE